MLVPTKPTEEEADLVPLAWVPYADRAQAERRLGEIPAGLELDFYRADGDDYPGTIDEVAFYVLPYMRGPAVLERAAEEFARLRVPRELERARGLLAGLRA